MDGQPEDTWLWRSGTRQWDRASPSKPTTAEHSQKQQQLRKPNHQSRSSSSQESSSHLTASEQVRWVHERRPRTRCGRRASDAKAGPQPARLLIKSIVILVALLPAQLNGYQLANNLIANNSPPKFAGQSSEMVVRVKEGPGSVGKLIYTLRGEDPDEDPLTFGVLGATASELLRVENAPGNQAKVYLRKELDRETTESYQVVITLTDGKLGRGNWITKSMLIIVEDVNDNYPVFGPHRTAISIREDARAPMVVETIEASDQDEGRFGQVVYRLEELGDEGARSSASQVFSIETVDGRGVISLVGTLDYEQRPLHQLRVLAVDRAAESERLSASTSILVSVEDCADQPPLFTFVPSVTRIPEDLPVGALVLRLLAVDGDRGINNPIQYRLVSVNGQESGPERNLFSIDTDSGQLSVAQPLDRESDYGSEPTSTGVGRQQQPGAYVLQVRATELAGPQQAAEQSVSTELTLLLTDVNDQTPQFSQPAYFGEILENSAPDSLVSFVAGPGGQEPISPKVVDRDQGHNGTFTLQLEGEHSHLFEVWPREATNEAHLMIKLSGSEPQLLDFERHRQFQFHIVARERFGTGSSRAQMSVMLRDANDNYPQFESELYRVELPENAARGMHVCAVKATDPDSGLFGSQGVRYTEIRGEQAHKFRLDPLSGVVTLRTNEHGFDRETVAQHHLIVEARDNNGSGNRNTTQLLILLTDVNDQWPKFLLDRYEASIYENEPEFQAPLQVQAVDGDAAGSANARLVYSIVAGDPHQNFTIEPHTGRIRVRSPLRPMSDGPEQEASLQEQDPGPAGLDFERMGQRRDEPARHFNLTVRATDAGLPEPLWSQTQVLVQVFDRNDHAPVFTRPIYSKSIREDAKEGSQVVQVLAQDGDHSPANSKISYRIASGGADKFVIDSDSGLISVANGANLDIDRVVGGQRRTSYLLSVLAFDGSFGAQQRSGSTLVNISIIDVNNKPPEFVQQDKSAAGQPAQLMPVSVSEDAPYGLIVARVQAIDLDSSAELRYSIDWAHSEARNSEDMALLEPGLIKDLFSIEPTDGTIKVARQLDRESFDQVRLRLQVEDVAAQTADQVAHAYLLVRITDVNDNRPLFRRPSYKAQVNENSISRTSIITLTADDRDLNKTLKYSLEGPAEMLRLVRINARSGEVSVNDKIDRELFPLINLTVRAEDYGLPYPLTGSAQLLITVRDENDNNPIFLNTSRPADGELSLSSSAVGQRPRSLEPELGPVSVPVPALPLLAFGSTARVPEDAPLGYQVAYVRAEDADVGNNGRVTYLLDPTSGGGKFRVERDTGIISVAGVLDRETVSQYSLIIEACDNYELGYATGESRRAFTQVSIQLSDVNDNAPTISSLQSASGDSAPASSGHLQPSLDELMSSPGPYDVPMADCLFISEFQQPNEPILTLTGTDLDDPLTPNGQVELALLNGPPLNELFALLPQRRVSETSTERPASLLDYAGFGELALGESGSTVSVIALGDERQSAAEQASSLARPTRAAPGAGNLYSPVARLQLLNSSWTAQQRLKQQRAHQLEPTTGLPNGGMAPLPAHFATPSQTSAEPVEQRVQLILTQSLKERVGNYSLLVKATDRGQPALSSVRRFNVCVQDVNNHAPVFARPPLNHTIRIMENATLGSYVTQVEASDADHGLNGELHYSLKQTGSNNDWQSFKIDRVSGLISTAKLFNRQLKRHYTLRVQAQDFGRPTSLASDIDINIMIVNSGQYQPEFDSQLQNLQFTENVAPGVEWFSLLPTTNLEDDPALIHADQPEGASTWLAAASPCYFIVDGDDHEQVFQLDRYTHRLTNQKPIDRERKANYTLLVRASNSCSKPPQQARARLEQAGVSNGATSASAGAEPAIEYRSESAVVPERASKRARRAAFDESANETYLADELTANQLSQAAIDGLLLADKSLLKVFIKIKDVNDNAPRFTQRVYTGGITTEADFGTVFMIVQALDPDADANGQVVYSMVKSIKRNLARSLQRREGIAGGNLVNTSQPPDELQPSSNPLNDIPMDEGDDLFVINAQTGEISLNFDPQKHMKGYFEFEILANDTDGLSDSAKVFIYLLRQDQRVKFVLRLSPQELRQRLNKFRSVFGNITGAIVNIDSYKYFENQDGTVDKKKTSLYLHFVNPDDNTIIEVDKVLTLIDNNIEYLDQLYKEFHVLSSEAVHLPLSSSALIDPVDQIRTGLLGVSSFLALILVLVIALCLNQRTRYERQLKAATVSAFGSSPNALHLNPDYHSQTNLPNTNLHSQDPNPIWMNGYADQDWLGGGDKAAAKRNAGNVSDNAAHTQIRLGIEEADYLTSSEHSEMNSLNGVNGVGQLHYNAGTSVTPRDSLNSSQGQVSGSGGSSATSTTNDRQVLCRSPQQQHHQTARQATTDTSRQSGHTKRSQVLPTDSTNNGGRSTFGATFKEVTIYTTDQRQYSQPAGKQPTSQVNKIALQFNQAQRREPASTNQSSQIYQVSQQTNSNRPLGQHRILVHANGADPNQGIIKAGGGQQPNNRTPPARPSNGVHYVTVGADPVARKSETHIADNFEQNLNKLSILNLETTEL